MDTTMTAYRTRLRELLTKHFDEEELRTLSMDVGVDYDDLPGKNKTGKARELITYLERRQGLRALIEAAAEERPGIPWDYAPEQREDSYLQGLARDIDQYLSRVTLSPHAAVLHLEGRQTLEAVDRRTKRPASVLPVAFFDMLPNDEPVWEDTASTDLETLFDKYDGRVLLLGEPGTGKTITLMLFGREAVRRRLAGLDQPFPFIVPVATWDAKAALPLVDWLGELHPTLDKDEIRQVLHEGKALLLLDGLDELGSTIKNEQTGIEIDPRRKFFEIIPPNNQILLTCRTQEYKDISAKAQLNGAITLLPLTDEQRRVYLSNVPELLTIVESDSVLRELTRIPLILGLFASAFQGLDSETRKLHNLSRGAMRDRIFGTYIKRRYEIETRKLRAEFVFTLDEIYDVLGQLAMQDAGGGGNMNVFHADQFKRRLSENAWRFIDFTIALNLLQLERGEIIRFAHMLLRDHFAFHYAQSALTHPSGDVRDSAAWALWQIPDERAVDVLIPVLNDPYKYARGSAAGALGRIGDERAVEPLIRLLADEEPVGSIYGSRISEVAATALGMIDSPRAREAIEQWKRKRSGSKAR